MTSSKVERWDLMLKHINSSLTDLLARRFFYREILSIINNNPGLEQLNHFISWLLENYLLSGVMAVRRLVDDRKDVISLQRFLIELKQDPRILSRKRYFSLFKNTGLSDDYSYINHCFDTLVGEGEDYLDIKTIEDEIRLINEKYSPLEEYVNHLIAHSSWSEPRNLPNIRNLDECIDLLEDLFKKYYAIFYVGTYTSLVPVPQYPWKKIFKIPWIAS